LTAIRLRPYHGNSTLWGDSNRLEAVSSWGSALFDKVLLAGFLIASFSLAGAQTKPLPPGPVQAKVKATCTQCHNAARITEQHLTRQEWSTELDKMVNLGADVPDADRAALLNYLSKNFGPEKVGKATPKKSSEETK
jgi:hypothetical protein